MAVPIAGNLDQAAGTSAEVVLAAGAASRAVFVAVCTADAADMVTQPIRGTGNRMMSIRIGK